MQLIFDYIKAKLGSEPTGHDYLHAMRVYQNAKHLLTDELDETVILTSALIHDCIDSKLDDIYRSSKMELNDLMTKAGLSIHQIHYIIMYLISSAG